MGPPLGGVRAGLLLSALGCLLAVTSAAKKEFEDGETANVTYLFPIFLSSVPLSGRGGFESEKWAEKLTDIGAAKYEEYTEKTLPKELEIDKAFSDEYQIQDHSRINMAFQRWQKRAFADRYKIPASQLTSQGARAPKLQGIDYSWPELYDSPEFEQLKEHIAKLAKVYLKRAGYDPAPDNFRIFIWVEVFGKGDAMRPHPRMDGAYCAGRYFAQAQDGATKFAFEDPRGINPPFGKTHNQGVYEGNMLMFPSWVSYFNTPNMHSESIVSFPFLVYPAEGNNIHWEGDKTAGIKVEKKYKPRRGN